MPTDAELNAIRAEIEKTFPDTIVVQTATHTNDQQGNWVDTWAASGTILGRIESAPFQFSGEDKAGGGILPHHSYLMTVAYDAVITTYNRAVANGETFEITSVDDAKSWAVDKLVTMERVP